MTRKKVQEERTACNNSNGRYPPAYYQTTASSRRNRFSSFERCDAFTTTNTHQQPQPNKPNSPIITQLCACDLSLSILTSSPVLNMKVRRSEAEDGRLFNSLVTNLGGPNLFRALFGQYNYTSLVEYSYCSLIGLDESEQCGLFATFNDGMLTTQDTIPFNILLDALGEILPCRVSLVYFDAVKLL